MPSQLAKEISFKDILLQLDIRHRICGVAYISIARVLFSGTFVVNNCKQEINRAFETKTLLNLRNYVLLRINVQHLCKDINPVVETKTWLNLRNYASLLRNTVQHLCKISGCRFAHTSADGWCKCLT